MSFTAGDYVVVLHRWCMHGSCMGPSNIGFAIEAGLPLVTRSVHVHVDLSLLTLKYYLTASEWYVAIIFLMTRLSFL